MNHDTWYTIGYALFVVFAVVLVFGAGVFMGHAAGRADERERQARRERLSQKGGL